MRARDAGFEVIYQGIRLTPRSRSLRPLWRRTFTASGCRSSPDRTWSWSPRCSTGSRAAGLAEVPVIVGGIIPESDAEALEAKGVAAVFTPKDFDLTQVMNRIVDEIRRANQLDPA